MILILGQVKSIKGFFSRYFLFIIHCIYNVKMTPLGLVFGLTVLAGHYNVIITADIYGVLVICKALCSVL